MTENSRRKKEDKMCNCRNKAICPVKGKCLKTAVVYGATLQTEEAQYQYNRLTEHTSKARYNAHNCSFRNVNQRLSTELSKKVWELKELRLIHTIYGLSSDTASHTELE